MDEAYGVTCLACGRDLGCIFRGQYVARGGHARLERRGRGLRCGHCRGGVLLEPDPMRRPPRDRIDALKRSEATSGRPRHPYRRREG
jgi:hypothetical protein